MMLHELNRVQRQLPAELAHMFRLMDSAPMQAVRKATTITPKMNIVATPKSVEVYVIAAGIDADSLDVTIDNNVLTISGELKSYHDVNVNDVKTDDTSKDVEANDTEAVSTQLLLNEYSGGTFKRSVALPEEVDPAKVEAKLEQGVLHLSIMKKETTKPQKIAVTVA